MNLDIPNIEGNIDTESVDNWVQQLESYYSMNQLSEDEKITIASLKMLTSVRFFGTPKPADVYEHLKPNTRPYHQE